MAFLKAAVSRGPLMSSSCQVGMSARGCWRGSGEEEEEQGKNKKKQELVRWRVLLT